MCKQLDIIVYGHNIARLITKHGGWIDEVDEEIVRFPTSHAMAMFNRELDEQIKKDKQS
jgi:hypothetical protein